ncbi:MAG: lipopolysaccharide modification acyltransferase [Gammaproteobacteria bacterium]|jgi:peptidoglycan/LPS O-acetylase OafA/YrhL|nr:lipopolysaccharide modification acyltransferase [Gammaproteobacteria bacterium]
MAISDKSVPLTLIKYRSDIDGLRAIAILSVVGFHAFPSWVTGGFIGVDIFFVISGFLISTIIIDGLKHDTFSFFGFYCRRIKRIFPALLLVLITLLILGWFILLADDYSLLGKHVAGGAGFISNFLLWNESGYFDNAVGTKPLLHLWSLCIEEQFYIFWPLLLWIASKRRLSLLKFAVMLGLFSFVLNAVKIQSDKVAAFYSPQTRFWELMVGAGLACIILNKQKFINLKYRFGAWLSDVGGGQEPEIALKILVEVLSAVGAVLLVTSVYIISEKNLFPGWWALLPVLGTVLIISSGQETYLNRKFLSNRVLVWLGLISYPLYLWHWPLLSLARIAEGHELNAVIRIAIVLLSAVLAWLTYKVIENPLRASNFAFPLLCVMVFTGWLGFHIYGKKGFPGRFPELKSIDVTGYEFGGEWKMHTCYLQLDKGDKLFPNRSKCIEQHKHIIFLWGDSFAAALYPGLNSLERSRDFGIAFFAANSCPPLLGWDNPSRPFCKEINDRNLKTIKEIMPDIVLLHANWTATIPNSYPIEMLANTIIGLKKLGVPRVIILGPVPVWGEKLSEILFSRFKADPFHRIPERIKPNQERSMISASQLLEVIAKKAGAEYIQSYDYFCNDEGCLDRIGDGKGSIVSADNAHLSVFASEWFLKQIQNKLFER